MTPATITNAARSVGLPDAWHDDLGQEAYLRGADSYKAVRNVAIDMARQAFGDERNKHTGETVRLDSAVSIADTRDILTEREERRDTINTLDRLVKRARLTILQQRALALLYIDDLTVSDVAKALGVSEGRVSVLRHSALKRLRSVAGVGVAA